MTKKRKIKIFVFGIVLVTALFVTLFIKKPQYFSDYEIGDPIDSLNHVYVYYNGGTSNVSGRNTTSDGYNIGLKYQCVEFVKRYYYEFYDHKMPNTYGHAVSFFDKNVSDGALNKDRNLVQFSNPSYTEPKVGDLIVLDATVFNEYGHVAIISEVRNDEIEIIQQNPGVSASSRVWIAMDKIGESYKLANDRVLGWLRMK